MNSFKIIRVSAATPFARGEQYGQQARDEIVTCIETYKKRFMNTRNMTWEKVRAFAMTHLPDVEASVPELLEEVKGIAHGAGIDFEDAMVLNSRYEILHYPYRLPECTAFALEREATADGHVYVGQNWDQRPEILDHALLIDIVEEETGNHIFGMTEAGQLIRNGISTNGVAQCSNSLHSCLDGVGHGLPSNFVRRKLLTMHKLSDMVDFIRAANRSVSVNYCLGSCENTAADVEAVPGHCVRISPVKGIITHANNLEVNQDMDTFRNEHFRAKRLYDLLALERGNITTDYIKECLKDHVGYPGSICNHTFEQKKPWQTVASVIYDVDAKTAWVCYGPPCQGEYIEYQL